MLLGLKHVVLCGISRGAEGAALPRQWTRSWTRRSGRGDDTRTSCQRICPDSHGCKKATARVVAFLSMRLKIGFGLETASQAATSPAI
jgi:hypothetical protein